MNEFVKLIKEIINTSRERFKTPITRNYIYFLLAWNWKIVYYMIFSESNAETKLMYLKYHTNFLCYLIPLIMAILYLRFIDEIMKIFENSTKEAKKTRSKNYYEFETDKAKKSKDLAIAEFERDLAKTGNETLEGLKNENQILLEDRDLKNEKINELLEELKIEKDQIVKLKEDLILLETKYKLEINKQNYSIDKINLMNKEIAMLRLGGLKKFIEESNKSSTILSKNGNDFNVSIEQIETLQNYINLKGVDFILNTIKELKELSDIYLTCKFTTRNGVLKISNHTISKEEFLKFEDKLYMVHDFINKHLLKFSGTVIYINDTIKFFIDDYLNFN